MSVIDVGCAAGQITAGFAGTVSPGDVLGVDTSEEAIGRARTLAQDLGLANLRFEVASAYELPAKDGYVDVVHFHAVLSHLASPERALAEAWRVLKPGGILATREPDKCGDVMSGPYADAAKRMNRLTRDDWVAAGGDPCLGRRLKGVVREAGFEVIQTGAVFDWADVASTQAAGVVVSNRLQEQAFRDRALAAGIVDLPTLEWLKRSMEARRHDPDAFQAFAEVEVLARKG